MAQRLEVVWSPRALRNAGSIYEFIARDSEVHAAQTLEKFFAATDRLASFPRSGRLVPEYQDRSFRELIEGNYRILFRVSKAEVLIVSVVHGMSLLPRNL